MVYLFTVSTICVRSKFGYGKPLYINLLVFSDPAIVEQPLGKEPFREPVSSIAVGCQLDPADPFLSVVLFSPVALIMDISYLTVGHFECNGLPYGHCLSDLFLPIALRMDFCHWSGSYFECNILPHGSGLIDLLSSVAIRMDIYINGVLVILSATDFILEKVYLLSFRMDLSHQSSGLFECNGFPHGHSMLDLLLPIALRMDLSHQSSGLFECNGFPHGHYMSDLRLPIALKGTYQSSGLFECNTLGPRHMQVV